MNTRQPSPAAQFASFVARFPPDIVAVAKRCMPKLRRAFPGCNQIVYNYSGSVVVAFGLTDRGYESIMAIAVSPRGVRLYFDKSLPDPTGLFEGSGSKVRSVTIEAASDLDRGDIKALIKVAIKRSGAAVSRARSTRMIIKTGSKKRRARKSAQRA